MNNIRRLIRGETENVPGIRRGGALEFDNIFNLVPGMNKMNKWKGISVFSPVQTATEYFCKIILT